MRAEKETKKRYLPGIRGDISWIGKPRTWLQIAATLFQRVD